MKIVHIQYLGPSGVCAAMRLHKAFMRAGLDSTFISLYPDHSGNERVIFLKRKARLISRLDNIIQSYLTRKRIKEFGNFSYPVLGSNISQMKEVKAADFIYLHWALNGFLNLRSIRQLTELNKPIIVYLHDMWPITGGCHHSFTCEKYKAGCSNCQVFSQKKKYDLSYSEFKKKLKLYSKYENLYFVAPSKWMYDCARQSALTKGKEVFQIPNVLDNTLFKPFAKSTARQILNIDSSETILAFGAVSITDPYKGWDYLQKALSLLYQKIEFKNVSVLIFGSSGSEEIAGAIPFKTRFMGYLHDEYSTALVYNAADVIITPSLAESFGYVVMESLSCGTPVVGFNVGGIVDLIQHKRNGYLAKYRDAEDLAEGIQFCLQNHIEGYRPAEFAQEITMSKHLELLSYLSSHKRDKH